MLTVYKPFLLARSLKKIRPFVLAVQNLLDRLFDQEKGAFNLEIELRGIVEVEGSSCAMLGN